MDLLKKLLVLLLIMIGVVVLGFIVEGYLADINFYPKQLFIPKKEVKIFNPDNLVWQGFEADWDKRFEWPRAR